MPFTSIAKEQSLVNKLKEELSLATPTITTTTAQDSAGAQLLLTAGASTMAIRVKSMATDFTDSLGLPQKIYSPMVIQVVEDSTDVMAAALKLSVENQISRLSVTKQERYSKANPALSDFATDGTVTGATAITTLAADPQWPLSGQ